MDVIQGRGKTAVFQRKMTSGLSTCAPETGAPLQLKQLSAKTSQISQFLGSKLKTAALTFLATTMIMLGHLPASAQVSDPLADPEAAIEDHKKQEGEYNGSVITQKMIADHYRKQCCSTSGRVRTSRESQAIDAYVWYSLAALQSRHAGLLNDPARQLGEEDESAARDALDILGRMKKTRQFADGPARWMAEKQISDVYARGHADAQYMMGIMYKSGLHMIRSNYNAYVYMCAAALRGYGDAAQQLSRYQYDIQVGQIASAELEARLIVMRVAPQQAQGSCSSLAGSYSSGTGGGGGSIGAIGAGGSGNWGSDFHTQRSAGNSGSGLNPALTPAGMESNNNARAALEMGNAAVSVGDLQSAKGYYETAIRRDPYSRAAIDASRQLQALTLTCSVKEDRIARNASPENRSRVMAGVSWTDLQFALKALGYYKDYVDGNPGLETRRAIRSFQRNDLNVDDTGYLTVDQRVELICAAAQDVRDAQSQVVLGTMYATGNGLNCNTAAAHAWFQKAADQGHPTALYNLGYMYLEGFYDRNAPTGSGKIPGEKSEWPYKIRDEHVAQNYFKEAKDRGHPDAPNVLKNWKSISKSAPKKNTVIGCTDYEIEVGQKVLIEGILSLEDSVLAAAEKWSSMDIEFHQCANMSPDQANETINCRAWCRKGSPDFMNNAKTKVKQYQDRHKQLMADLKSAKNDLDPKVVARYLKRSGQSAKQQPYDALGQKLVDIETRLHNLTLLVGESSDARRRMVSAQNICRKPQS